MPRWIFTGRLATLPSEGKEGQRIFSRPSFTYDNYGYTTELAVALDIEENSIRGAVYGTGGPDVYCFPELGDKWHTMGLALDFSAETYSLSIDGD